MSVPVCGGKGVPDLRLTVLVDGGRTIVAVQVLL